MTNYRQAMKNADIAQEAIEKILVALNKDPQEYYWEGSIDNDYLTVTVEDPAHTEPEDEFARFERGVLTINTNNL